MKRWTFVLILIILGFTSLIGQRSKYLKGVSEFRAALFEVNELMLSQNEIIRIKLDSIGVDSTEYIKFLFKLYYVVNNIYETSKPGLQYMINQMKSNRIYGQLSDQELAIIIDSFHLLFFPKTGIWGDRYPHKIAPKALRISEIMNYGIEEGDSVLHYKAFTNNALCPILYYSFDSIHVFHYPYRYSEAELALYTDMSEISQTKNKNLVYPPSKYAKLDESKKYDKIVFDGLGFLTYTIRQGFNQKFAQIHRLLKDDGVLIMGANAFDPPFDGTFEMANSLDKKMKDVYKKGFVLKEKILVENEFVVYKLMKE